ncbi:MAG: MFS transporter [Pseudomonadota bacterium]|nr:MFS transporter [Pseudomonadota bacterium]
MDRRRSGYSGYVLAVLLLAYTLNAFDRAILSLLLEPIRQEFAITDTQLGLLTGLGFGLFYATLSIPVAALADRWSRRNVLLLSMALWTVMTCLCGLAGSFVLLLLARIGVGIGQSGNNPASHSLIASYFPPARRATALGIVALGAPAGAMLAGLFGGWGGEMLGWRLTIILAGAPGLLLVPLLLLTVREPPAPSQAGAATGPIPLKDTLVTLWTTPAFRHLCIACALHSLSMYAASSFNPAYLARSHGWAGSQIGYLTALTGLAGLVGAFTGGFLTDRLRARHGEPRWQLWIPAIATLAVVPVQLTAYLGAGGAMVIAMLLSSLLSLMFFGPSYATAQALASPGSRAVAAALLLFSKAIVGMGLGPLLVGAASDLLAPLAGTHSLRLGMLLVPAFNVWAALHFIRAARHLTAGGASPDPPVASDGSDSRPGTATMLSVRSPA